MAIGLFLAVVVNQKIRGRDVLPGLVLLPGHRELGGDHDPVDLHRLPRRPVQRHPGGARPRHPLAACSGSRRTRTGSHDQDTALNSVIILNAWTTSGTFMLFYLASLQSISRRDLRSGRDRRGGRVADVPADHVPASAPGPLLRGHRRGDRRAPAVRPGDLRRRRQRRPEQRPDDDGACTSTTRPSSSSTSAWPRRSGVILFVLIFSATLVQRRLFGQDPGMVRTGR